MLYFLHRSLWIKRDDLVDPGINGNKARKFTYLIEAQPEKHRRVLSHGGNQSNAMNALALLCTRKKWRFTYYTRPLPAHLRQNPAGNLKRALDAGMELIECSDTHEEIALKLSAISQKNPLDCYVPMGGKSPLAAGGVKTLAKEIKEFAQSRNIGHLNVILSSGTGTTALYLAKFLQNHTVFTVPCAGGKGYLQEQMKSLEPNLPENLFIIEGPRKHAFARPCPEFLETYNELLEAQIEFDLLYDVKTWHTFKENPELLPEGEIMFVHSGGVEGNPTQLLRYERAGLLEKSTCTSP